MGGTSSAAGWESSTAGLPFSAVGLSSSAAGLSSSMAGPISSMVGLSMLTLLVVWWLRLSKASCPVIIVATCLAAGVMRHLAMVGIVSDGG